MKKLNLLWTVIKRLQFDKILTGFVLWYVASSVLIMVVEPGINSIGDALWYTFVGCTSIGFGDFVAVTLVGRILTVVMTVYEIVVVAMFSGVVVSYYLEVVHRRENKALTLFMDKMEHLSELSEDELKEIEKKFRELK